MARKRWVDTIHTQAALAGHLSILGWRNALQRHYVKRPCRSVTAEASKVENMNDGCARHKGQGSSIHSMLFIWST